MHNIWAQQEEPHISQDSISKDFDRASDLFEQNRYGESIEIYTRVLDYAIRYKHTTLEADTYSMLGNNYYEINKKDDTLVFYYLFKARDIFLREKNDVNLIGIYNDIGGTYSDFDQLEKSNEYLNKALKLAKEIGFYDEMIYPLSNIASNEIFKENKYKVGIKNSFKVLHLIDSLKVYESQPIVGYTYLELSYGYFKIGDKDKHLLYFNKCLDFSKKNKHIGVLEELYDENAELYFEDKNYKKAYSLVKESMVIKDSLNTLKEYEKAKQIEANSFISENKEKLLLVKKENEFQEITIKKSKGFTILFALLAFGLLVSLYFIYRKNKELKLAKEEAEKLSKVKSNFYSEISHELRTPLYAVIELSKLLLNENVNSSQKEYLESLNFSGNHLLSLINNVLELNKIESGELRILSTEFKLKNLISNIIDSLEFALNNSHNKIHVNYDKNIPDILLGDSLKLSQVFINLISNAIKFTRNGNIYITTKLINNLEDKVTVFFEVKDDGVGISKENQIKVFEEFFQEDLKIEKSYKGTGLGLSIVKTILTAMNSEITIESKIDKGAIFRFEIDFLKNEKSFLVEKKKEVCLKNLLTKNILIVDDNKINQLVTKKILDKLGIKSKTVDSGSKAISIVKEEHFDCILMDLYMPGLDGYETTSLIRAFNKDIAIVAFTAASTDRVESKITNFEMNGLIMKPFIESDFIETISRAIIKP